MRLCRLLPLLALPGALAVWLAWPDEPPAVAPGVAQVLQPSPPEQGPVAVAVRLAVVAASAPAPAPVACPAAPPWSARDQALALQRAVAHLASGSGGDAVLALLMQRPAEADEGWRQQVRLAALRSHDAQALRWAAAACTTSACRRELLQERLRLEPDNAVHWLAWLDENPVAADDAWQGLAAARAWREAPWALDERITRALPPGLLPAQREALLRPVREQAWAAAPPRPATLAGVCGHYGPAHPVGAACANLAALMLAQGDSAAAWQQGAELARQLGRQDLPAPPLEPQRAGDCG